MKTCVKIQNIVPEEKNTAGSQHGQYESQSSEIIKDYKDLASCCTYFITLFIVAADSELRLTICILSSNMQLQP